MRDGVHEFTGRANHDTCRGCGITRWDFRVREDVSFSCPGPKPAGNTGRHLLDQVSDYVATPAGQKAIASIYEPKPSSLYDGLWDRLRADLSNLGAAYGELPTTTAPVEIPPLEVAWIDQAPTAAIRCTRIGHDHGTCKTICSSCVTRADFPWYRGAREPEPQLTEPDLNLYYDGIILAARKKRERQNTINYCDREDGRTWDARQAEHDRAQMLSAAMDRPLSFPKRIGWKPGDCE